jgi:hypothetical protein
VKFYPRLERLPMEWEIRKATWSFFHKNTKKKFGMVFETLGRTQYLIWPYICGCYSPVAS